MMGVSVNWLKQYVDIKWSAEELAHRLTMAGIAIEGINFEDNDYILNLDLTPNRSDCLGMINLAREVAALTGSSLHCPTIILNESKENIDKYIKVEVDASDLCQRYAVRLIKNVKITDSPEWMQEALIHSGIRPINNIVDVTNYVMMECNQPLHAFDYCLLGNRILVRRAHPGEQFITLDGIERQLDGDMLMITDGNNPVALAGVMGGLNTEIHDDTVDVLLESAWFLGSNIRRTSRKLGLRSESSMRFEKGTDINGVLYAVDRAAMLIQQLAGGEVVKDIYDVYPNPRKNLQVTLRPERVNFLLGTDISTEQIKSYLEMLKFPIKTRKGNFLVDIPSYRPDIEIEVDLIEEVARLHGYDKIEAALPEGETTLGSLTPYQKFQNEIKNIISQNLNEVINFSFTSEEHMQRLLLPDNSPLLNLVKVANPLSEEQAVMRTLLLPGLLHNVSNNLARRNENLAFFEMGAVFNLNQAGLPTEKLKLGAIVCGHSELNWTKYQVDMDFFYLKGILENLLRHIGLEEVEFVKDYDPSYHPGRSAVLKYYGDKIGIIGEVHPLVLENFDIKQRACVFELDMEKLFVHKRTRQMDQITRYPAVERDIAVVLNNQVTAAQALAVIRDAEKELLKEVVVFDIYTGEQVPEGYKSIAFKMTFQSMERTLTDYDINTSVNRILQRLQQDLNAELR
ncbi:MAG: phenylalanine--tRNA ligase subunit beta [Syntrophomonadaceae bacterium]|jgi:phenylalanyl-tRNA synthetase beta chain